MKNYFLAYALCLIMIYSFSSKAGETEKVFAEGYAESVAESKKESADKKAEPTATLPPKGKYPDSLVSIGQGDYFSKYAFVADKKERTLSVWQNNQGNIELVGSYPIDMGKKNGDKFYLGDLKTPEGIYFFQTTYNKQQLDYNEYGERAFTMDYPNFFDRADSKTGSGIWLHAIPETKTLYRGSRGCLVVRNNIIHKLANYINLKTTPIIVANEVKYVSKDDFKKSSNKFNKWLEAWRSTWQSKDITNYIAFYHDDFKSLKMNKDQWKAYKQTLNAKYNYINVKLHEPVIYKYNDEIIVRFLQQYESDTLTDFGEKYLYVKESTDGKYHILNEDWVPAGNDLIAKFNEKCKVGC